jgi:LysM repeat protein
VPISTAQFSLPNNIRQQIVSPDRMPQHVCIHNHEHSSNSTVYIGGPDVTTANGIHAQATLTSQITIGPGDSLWAISDTADVNIQVLIVKQD